METGEGEVSGELGGGIIYSLIARGTIVLVEHANREGNFVTLANRILTKVPSEDHRKSYKDKSGSYMFHYMVQEGITYLCFATKGHKTGVCFGFLDEISKKFTSIFDKAQMLTAHAYDARYAGFERALETEMERFSQMTSVDQKLSNIHDKIDRTTQVMKSNIEEVINRGDNIDSLLQRTSILVTDSDNFQTTAKKVKVKMWWRNMYVWVIMAVVAIVLIWLVFSIACGFDFGCLKYNNGN